jgi:acyl-CoA thioester hydrolase
MDDVRDFEFEMAIRWGDMDAMGHVNNTLYFRYLEQARISWFDAVFSAADLTGFGPILAHVSCDFIRPLIYPGSVRVRQVITRLGRSSVEMDLSIARSEAPDELFARGRSVMVWISYPAQQSAPWPEHLRILMEPERPSKA